MDELTMKRSAKGKRQSLEGQNQGECIEAKEEGTGLPGTVP